MTRLRTVPPKDRTRSLIDSELESCRSQRDQATQMLAQAQQAAQNAQQTILQCTGAEIQLTALLAKLAEKEAPDEVPTP